MRLLPLLFALLLPGSLGGAQAAPLAFNRDIRPILSENCFACHGFDEKHREAKLRLDLRDSATAVAEDGSAPIVPGKPEESLIWQRIQSTDADEVMPPPDSHKTLTADQKATIKQWITEGAVYEKHWAFEPPVKAEGGIDHWVKQQLAEQGLSPNVRADRSTLIRRVSLALTGLPPSLNEVDTFLRDTGDGSYERMVDRYLASPHFGEEMARHWLDVARYGDTHGMHLDNERQMWAFRDWVVSAFNSNLPYDEFTIAQIAGDLLPKPTQDQMIATGFNRCNVTTGEGGSIAKEWIHRYAVDRASTTAQAWLGLTAGCAVCHDHKYDPITQKDFYSLYAFFQSNADPAMDGNKLLTAPVVKVKPEDYDEKMRSFTKREKDVQEKIAKLATETDYQDPATQDPKPPAQEVENIWFDDAFPKGAQAQNSTGPLNFVDTPVHSGKKSLRVAGPEMAQSYYQAGAAELIVPAGGRFFLHLRLDPADPPEEVMIQFHSSAWSHRAIWGADLIDWGKAGTGERFPAGALPPADQWAKLEFNASDVGLKVGSKIKGFAFTVHGGAAYFDKMGVIGRSDPAADPALSYSVWLAALPDKEKKALPKDDAGKHAHYLANVCATTKAHFAPLQGELAKAQKARTDYDASVHSTFVFGDLPKPRQSFVMIRGEYDSPGEEVQPDTPAVLPPMKKAGERGNRLDLARWMVAPENPLTARVAVNRFWQQLFGVGLVKSSHDFGTQGDLPSHPELLDGLAVSFVESGWDVKALLRTMLISETFKQESAAPPASWAADPENTWLSRGPRFRLDAEQVRDQALFVGGLIKLQMGGKGVNPYQPPNIWEPLGFGGSNTRYYKRGNGDELYRRTLYTFIKRTAPHPLMDNFNMPNREESCIRRDRTNTPLQALQLMNDVQHFEAARSFASLILKAAADTPARIDYAYRRALARPASPEETAAITELLDQQTTRYSTAPEDATKAITFGDSKPPGDLNPAELAAWSLVANLILNLDEAIMRN